MLSAVIISITDNLVSTKGWYNGLTARELLHVFPSLNLQSQLEQGHVLIAYSYIARITVIVHIEDNKLYIDYIDEHHLKYILTATKRNTMQSGLRMRLAGIILCSLTPIWSALDYHIPARERASGHNTQASVAK